MNKPHLRLHVYFNSGGIPYWGVQWLNGPPVSPKRKRKRGPLRCTRMWREDSAKAIRAAKQLIARA